MATTQTRPVQTRRRRKQLFAGSVGHLVEWFDWSAYAFLAVFFADQFFPSDDTGGLPMLETFSVFAVGFLTRPLGGLMIGAFGDRYGRRAAMSLSVGLMGLGAAMIALAPTYSQAGIVAPILLVLARLIQGISAGGEWGSASSFLVEAAPDNRRGLYSSSLYVGSTLGKILLTALGTGLIALIGEAAMVDFGWRLMFGFSALLAVVAWWIRRSADETVAPSKAKGRRPGLFDFLRKNPRGTLQVLGITAGPAAAVYAWTAFLPAYAVETNAVTRSGSLVVVTVVMLAFAVAQPLAGMLSDRVGRKPLLIVTCVAQVLLPGFAIDAVTDTTSFLLVQGIGLLTLALTTSISAAVMVEIFPPSVRVSGIGVAYAVSVAVFGGTAPFFGTLAAEGGNAPEFGWYLAATGLFSLLTVLTLRETAHRPLATETDG